MCSRINHLQYKFCHLLEKIKNDDPRNIPFFSRFESIKDDILFKTKDGLYYEWDLYAESDLFDLIDALSECWAFACKRDAAVDHKGLLSWSVYPSELLFRRKMARRLRQVDENLKLRLIARWRDRITPPSNYDTIIVSSIKNYLIHSRQARDYEGFSAIAITGNTAYTGFGRKVFDSLTSQEFDIKIWVEAERRKEYVVRQMLEQVGFKCDKKRITQAKVVHHLKELRKRLEGKRYLIVFNQKMFVDAYWYSDLGFNLPQGGTFEDKLSHALPKGSGGAVIVTTHYEREGIKVVGNRNKLINLDYLLEDVSCLIFERALDKERPTQDEVQIAEKLKNYILKNILLTGLITSDSCQFI